MIAAWWLALVGCNPTPTWTGDGAFAPHHARLDRDGSGAIEPAEYGPLAPDGPPFRRADTDRSGGISPAELQALVLAQDPLRFDEKPLPQAFTEIVHPGEYHPDSFEQRVVRESLTLLRDELLHLAPERAAPEDDAIAAAAATGRLDSPESQIVLGALRAGFDAEGRALPPPFGASDPEPGPEAP